METLYSSDREESIRGGGFQRAWRHGSAVSPSCRGSATSTSGTVNTAFLPPITRQTPGASPLCQRVSMLSVTPDRSKRSVSRPAPISPSYLPQFHNSTSFNTAQRSNVRCQSKFIPGTATAFLNTAVEESTMQTTGLTVVIHEKQPNSRPPLTKTTRARSFNTQFPLSKPTAPPRCASECKRTHNWATCRKTTRRICKPIALLQPFSRAAFRQRNTRTTERVIEQLHQNLTPDERLLARQRIAGEGEDVVG